ncbi:MAG: HAD family phosphatase [Anaerolineales bacterium]|nr:HAD family phosphatase [Anaerolineales bacterium]
MTPFQGIIFDFNGVLWWDGPLVEESWQAAAFKIRGRPFTPEETARIMHGRDSRGTMEYLAGRPLSREESARLVGEKEAHYRDLCRKQGEAFRLSPGAEELLEYLRERGIPRTIATVSIIENVDFFVRRLRLDRWFNTRLIVYDDGILPGKPAPDFYLKAAENLKRDPARCVVVEDSLSGIQAARAAGIGRVIGLTTNQPAEALLGAGAHETVENLGQADWEQLFGPVTV